MRGCRITMLYKLDKIKSITYTGKDNVERTKNISLFHLKNDMFHIVVCFHQNDSQFEDDIKYMKKLCYYEVRKTKNADVLKQKDCFKFLMKCGFEFLFDHFGREITSSDHVEEFFKHHFISVLSIQNIYNYDLLEASEVRFGRFVSCNIMDVSVLRKDDDEGDEDDDTDDTGDDKTDGFWYYDDDERKRRAYYKGFKEVSLLQQYSTKRNGETG